MTKKSPDQEPIQIIPNTSEEVEGKKIPWAKFAKKAAIATTLAATALAIGYAIGTASEKTEEDDEESTESDDLVTETTE